MDSERRRAEAEQFRDRPAELQSASALLEADLKMFGRLGIEHRLLAEVHVCRMTDIEARTLWHSVVNDRRPARVAR